MLWLLRTKKLFQMEVVIYLPAALKLTKAKMLLNSLLYKPFLAVSRTPDTVSY